MKIPFLLAILVCSGAALAASGPRKVCAKSLTSNVGLNAVCILNLGRNSERLVVTAQDGKVLSFLLNNTTPQNAGINPEFTQEESVYFQMVPRPVFPVKAVVTKSYDNSVLEAVQGTISAAGVPPAEFSGEIAIVGALVKQKVLGRSFCTVGLNNTGWGFEENGRAFNFAPNIGAPDPSIYFKVVYRKGQGQFKIVQFNTNTNKRMAVLGSYTYHSNSDSLTAGPTTLKACGR